MQPKDCPVGPKKKRRRSSKKDLEGPVVRECLKFLSDNPYVLYVERRNTGAIQFEDGGFIRFGKKGAADIWCLVKQTIEDDTGLYGYVAGRSAITRLIHVEIECKRADGKGRLSPDQKLFKEFCDSHGIPYILTTSAIGLSEKLKAICT